MIYKLKTFNRGLLLVLCPALLLLATKRDFWDGSLFAFGQNSGHLEGAKYSFLGQGWWLNYYISSTLVHFSNLLGISYPLISKIVILFCLLGVGFELERIFLVFRFNKWSREIGVGALFILPITHVFLSSVFVAHIAFIFFGVTASRLMVTKSSKWIIYLPLMIASFELNSMLVFVPILMLTMHCKLDKKEDSIGLKLTVVIAIATLYFTIHNLLLAPKGEFKSYNAIAYPFTLSQIKFYLIAILHFSSFMPFLLVIAAALVMPVKNIGLYKYDFLFVIIIFLAGVLPYLAVNKSTNLLDADWNQRQALLLLIAIPLMVACLVNASTSSEATTNFRSAKVVSIVAVLTLFSYFGFDVYEFRILESARSTQLQAIKLIDPILDKSKEFVIYIPKLPVPIRSYDTDYLMSEFRSTYPNVIITSDETKIITLKNSPLLYSFQGIGEKQRLADNIQTIPQGTRYCQIFLRWNENPKKQIELDANFAKVCH